MNYIPEWLYVAIGAALGGVCRYLIGLQLNPLHTHIMLGTLAVNVVGGFIMGVFVALPSSMIAPEYRLLITVGFLGGFTTFSSFSSEGLQLLLQGKVWWVIVHACLHVVSALLACMAGYYIARLAYR